MFCAETMLKKLKSFLSYYVWKTAIVLLLFPVLLCSTKHLLAVSHLKICRLLQKVSFYFEAVIWLKLQHKVPFSHFNQRVKFLCVLPYSYQYC